MSNTIECASPLTAALRPWAGMGIFGTGVVRALDGATDAVPAGKGAFRPRGVPR
jgi:hypothetical protein